MASVIVRAAGAAKVACEVIDQLVCALQASLRASYTWIGHISALSPTSYAKYASNPTLTFSFTDPPDPLNLPDPPCTLFSLSFHAG